MHVYAHPAEAREFFAPASEPVVPSEVPILHVSGLDNYVTPVPQNLRPASMSGVPRRGTGLNGTYFGKDFRAAYIPGSNLVGSGQRVGLFELNGYFANDVAAYLSRAGLPSVPLRNILIDGFNGSAGGRRPGSPNEEVALDIEMAISMAPGLDALLVYEASPASTMANINDLFNRMATDNLAKQLSCSWGFDIDINTQQIFKEFAAQGQSFFLASGDSGAFSGAVFQPADNPNVTLVGGTDLTTDSQQRWTAEVAWSGSSGGISTVYGLPFWQQGIDMSTNGGSTQMRNIPDVAMVANAVNAIADNGRSLQLSGTSIAAPLWAGFTALVNEQAASRGRAPVGFLNPALYAIGKSAAFTNGFHDVTSGSNANQDSLGQFSAVPGYDLCTGWGTPNGTNFINALLDRKADPLVLSSGLGFTANGPVGGPFNVTNQTYSLTNTGAAPLFWSVVSTSAWLRVSLTAGSLLPGASTNVGVWLDPSATNQLMGSLSSTVSFNNLTDGVSQDVRFFLLVANGGFENGDFSSWTFNGETDVNFATSIDQSAFTGNTLIPQVEDSQFVHSGLYGAFLGQNTSPGSLSQTLPTKPGTQYLVSFWLANPVQGAPNEFRVDWNGTNLFDQTDMPLTLWTNIQFRVAAGDSNSVLTFAFQNDQNAFGLDDVTVQPAAPDNSPGPSLQAITRTGNDLQLVWSSTPGAQYQVQFTPSIDAPNWVSVGSIVKATGNQATTSVPLSAAPGQGFFRIVQLPASSG
jgi:hypothetical protein